MKISHNKVTASVDTGMCYWYLFKHGLGPGTMPRGVNVLKVIVDGCKDYVLLDKMLTTEELNMYEIKEATPPDELLKEAGYNDISETYKEFGAATDVTLDVPQPFNNWYEIDTGDFVDDYGEPSEEISGYDVRHLAWVKAKDQYFDALSNNSLEYCELVSEGDAEPFLAQVIGDRLIPVSQEEVRQCVYEDDFDDVESAEQIEASKENPNIYDFYDWYNGLSRKNRNMVDDWTDEEGYPMYDDCSNLELSTIMDHFADFTPAGNFHVAAFGNDYDELQNSDDFNDPKSAITMWIKLQRKYPLNVMITGFAKQEQELRDYVVAHPDWIRKMCEQYKCPYDPEYLIAESEKPSRMKESEYTDQLHPFGLG